VGGQFTQEDPIGLAGGMNLYGFANGDPINFSDPFGLKADCEKPGDPSCSIKVDGRELNPDGYVLGNEQVRTNVAKLYSALVESVGNSNFTFQVTGGDRVQGSDGQIRSSSNGGVISESSKTSPHLVGRGARAADLRIRGVPDAVVDRTLSASTDFSPANIIRGYADRHTHVALPNRRRFYIKKEGGGE
jgi:hypothetical protein